MTADADSDIRGFVRPGDRHPAARQIKALISFGATRIYIHAKGKPMQERGDVMLYQGEDAYDEWLRSMDAGSVAAVATIARAAFNQLQLAETIRRLHERDAVLVEAISGRRSDNISDLPSLMLDAAREYQSRASAFTTASGRAAAERSNRARNDRRLSVSAARKIWKDARKYPTIEAALAQMDGWTVRTSYLHFGARHPRDPSRGGRPRKAK